MKITYFSSTDLKRKTAEVLNLVSFGEAIAIVERYGKPLVKIVSVLEEKKEVNLEEKLEKYFGAIPNFPEVIKMRYFRKKRLAL